MGRLKISEKMLKQALDRLDAGTEEARQAVLRQKELIGELGCNLRMTTRGVSVPLRLSLAKLFGGVGG